MNVMVMDVEGTDGRERGEDQVCYSTDLLYSSLLTISIYRTLSASRHCSRWPHLRFLLSTCGNTKLDCIKALTWVCSRPSSR